MGWFQGSDATSASAKKLTIMCENMFYGKEKKKKKQTIDFLKIH